MTDAHDGGYLSDVPPPPPGSIPPPSSAPSSAPGAPFTVPPSSAPSAGVPTYDVTPVLGQGDVIGNERKRRGASPLVAGLSAVAVLVAAAGVVGVMKLTGGAAGSTALAKYAPSSAFAFAEVDLAPSNAERAQLWSTLKKFPSSPANKSGASEQNLRDALLKQAFADSDNVDYAADVQPWLGDAAAVAGLTVDGKPAAVGIVDTKDDAKAKAGLAHIASKQGGTFAYDVRGGHAYISSDKKAIDAAEQDSASHALAKDSSFSSDVAKLGSDQLVTVWVDLARVKSAVADAMGSDTSNPFGNLIRGNTLDQLKGRLAVGVTVKDGVAILSGRAVGVTNVAAGHVGDLVSQLPDSTVAAIGFGDMSATLKQVTQRLGGMAGMFGGSDPVSAINDSVQQATGLTFPDDFTTILGDRSVVALGSVPSGDSGGLPEVGIRSHPKDLAHAKELADTLSQHLSDQGLDIGTKTAGGDLVLATTPSYADKLAGAGTLGKSAAFQKAVGDVSGANFVAYVDVSALTSRFAADNKDASAVGSVGIVERTDGDAQVFEIRVVTR